jgi:hypothetical protein
MSALCQKRTHAAQQLMPIRYGLERQFPFRVTRSLGSASHLAGVSQCRRMRSAAAERIAGAVMRPLPSCWTNP